MQYFVGKNDLYTAVYYKTSENGGIIAFSEIYNAFAKVCSQKASLFISEDWSPFDQSAIGCNIVAIQSTYFEELLIFLMKPTFKYYMIFNRR